jgi:hypothetical protein
MTPIDTAAGPTDAVETDTTQIDESTELDAEVQPGTETGTEEEGEAEAGENEETTDDDSDWLPEEQLREFPPEVIAKYAKRYGYTAEEIAADPRLAKTLHDKINSDIEIARQKAEAEENEESEETDDTETEEKPIDAAEQQKQWVAKVESFVDQVTDPEIAVKFIDDFTKAFEIKDPRERSIVATKVLSRGMVNLAKDLLPALLFGREGELGMLDRYMETRYEGFTDTVKTTSYSRTWDGIKTSDPAFAKLPAYDTRPGSPFMQAIDKAAELIPGFEDFKIPGKSPLENFKAKALIAARLLSGNGSASSVAAAARAVETGKRIARETQNNKQLGKLGAGQSKGQLARSTGDDPLKKALAEHRADDNPFAGISKSK